MATTVLLAACSAGGGSGIAGPSTPAGAGSSAEPTSADVVPSSSRIPDRGCLDEPGTLRARATAWYPGASGSPLSLDGERDKSAALDAASGSHIVVVRAVAPDGTTARVTAYGARAAAMAAGWPTTTAPSPSAGPAGLATLSVVELAPVASSVLAYVLDQR